MAHASWSTSWSEHGITSNLTFFELFPVTVVVVLIIWQSQFANSKLLFHIDNMLVVLVINQSTFKSDRVMNLDR